jgi:hypothetical protein
MISWLGMGVVRVLRVNASEPTVGWKCEHPQSVGWMQLVIDKYFHIPYALELNACICVIHIPPGYRRMMA